MSCERAANAPLASAQNFGEQGASKRGEAWLPPSRGRERRESIGGRETRGDERDREIQSLPSMTFPSGCHSLIALVISLISFRFCVSSICFISNLVWRESGEIENQ